MDAAKHVLMGLFMTTLAWAGLVSVFHLDRLWQFASLVSLGIVASAGAVVFFYAAIRGR